MKLTMKKNAYLWLAALLVTPLFAQIKKSGYWDTMRATTETIELRAGEKKVVKTNALPEGTTELVYRITLLDDNQKLSGSLVSVLKAIPDPTGISQGAAGAVFLASTISGDDKATFAIFSSESEANSYLTTGKTTAACYVQNTPVNKEARLLASDHLCVKNPQSALWFGFQSDNWLMKQKIVVEVVPWVDSQASTGWTDVARKEIVELGKKRGVYALLAKKEAYLVALTKNLMGATTYSNFKKISELERNQLVETAEKAALKETGESNLRSQFIAKKAMTDFQKGKTELGMGALQAEINAGATDAVLFASLIHCYLQTRQFTKAEICLKDALKFNPEDLQLKLEEAHVYLFTDKVSEAKALYKKYNDQNLPGGKSWKAQVLADLQLFEKSGLPNGDFKKIRRILE